MKARRSLADWRGGWWRPARACASPHADDRPQGEAPSLVVVHSISLPPGVYRGDAVERLFLGRLDCNRHPYYEGLRGLRVSAHFLIRRDGRVLQFVDCTRRAWHAGVSRWRARERCNDWSVGIELEGLEGSGFTGAQYRLLVRLVRRLCLRFPIADVVGHEHVAPGRKHDPGASFDWQRLQRAVRGCGARIWPLVEPID